MYSGAEAAIHRLKIADVSPWIVA